MQKRSEPENFGNDNAKNLQMLFSKMHILKIQERGGGPDIPSPSSEPPPAARSEPAVDRWFFQHLLKCL